jgi:tryptophan synthase beta chain
MTCAGLSVMADLIKYTLPEDRMPRFWYNIAADLAAPAPPPLHPGTGAPIGPPDFGG